MYFGVCVCVCRKVNIHEFSNRFQPGSELHHLFQKTAVSVTVVLYALFHFSLNVAFSIKHYLVVHLYSIFVYVGQRLTTNR